MYFKHPENPNLTLTTDTHFQGMEIYTKKGPPIVQYLEKIHKTIQRSLQKYPRTLVLRFDLYFQENSYPLDEMSRDMGLASPEQQPETISNVIRSVKSQMKSNIATRLSSGVRVHQCRLRYVWIREYSSTGRLHYHVAIMVNYDTYRSAGSVGNTRNGLALMITRAWLRVLNLDYFGYSHLVRFPENCVYHLWSGDPTFYAAYTDCFKRLSYFAKSNSKVFGQHLRAFGCSQG